MRNWTAKLAALAPLAATAVASFSQAPGDPQRPNAAPTLEETRLKMEKWIETQQLISKERNEWQQGKEILLGRLELVKKEVASLQEKIEQARSGVAEAQKKRDELTAESDGLKAVGAGLTDTVSRMEGDVQRLYRMLPDPIQTKLQPLHQRMPDESAKTRVTAAERFQNVVGILNEVNKSNGEINVTYEVHELAGGKPSEVQAIYIGLAQAYFVSAGGEAGIGRPSADGWKWEPSKAIAGDVLMALEILQGKQSPAFVPLPVRIQ